MTQITITVTEQHKIDGTRHHCHACPIAMALLEAGLSRPVVRPGKIGFYDRRGVRRNVLTPPEALIFMEEYDDECNPEPPTFNLSW